jgi:hypothetical protein
MTSNETPIHLQNEKKLFEWLKQEYLPDLTQSKTNSKYDCFSEKYLFDIEIKCRKKHYNDLLIEKKKYDFLMKRSDEFSTIPIYINSTPLGVWAFYIKDIRISWTTKILPKKTYWNDGTYIDKEIGYISISDGMRLDGPRV